MSSWKTKPSPINTNNNFNYKKFYNSNSENNNLENNNLENNNLENNNLENKNLENNNLENKNLQENKILDIDISNYFISNDTVKCESEKKDSYFNSMNYLYDEEIEIDDYQDVDLIEKYKLLKYKYYKLIDINDKLLNNKYDKNNDLLYSKYISKFNEQRNNESD